MLTHRYLLLIDALVLVLLMGYVTLGTEKVPFHGDESTTIWMSRDFDMVILDGDFGAVEYQGPPRRTTEQHMRIVTSNISKLAMGLAWSGTGMDVGDINDQWVWGADLQWNRDNGHVPSDQLLRVTRLTSAWMTALSVVFVLAIVRLVGGQLYRSPLALAVAGWGGAFLYATNPAILLNGRRAMFEGGLLLGMTLAAYGVLVLVKRTPRARWSVYAGVGIVTGMALSTKHSAAFTVVLLYGGLLAGGLIWQRGWINLAKIGLATVAALLVFLALNPLWWSQPLKMPGIVIEERQKILDQQVNLFGGYDGIGERVTGLWNEALRPVPQYFEANYWADYVGVKEEIARYEASGLAGWLDEWDIVFFAVRLMALGFGIWALVRSWRDVHYEANVTESMAARRLILILGLWVVGMLAISLVSVPLDWQRYYLPIQPPLAVVMGLGLGALVELWWRGQYVAL